MDNLLTVLTTIALKLEREANDNSLSDNLINVRNRARARATLSTVQAVLADDWLIQAMTIEQKLIGGRGGYGTLNMGDTMNSVDA